MYEVNFKIQSQLITLSSCTQLSKSLPIPAGDHSIGSPGRQVWVGADLSHFEGKQKETHFFLGGTGVVLYCSVAEPALHFYYI